VFTNGRILKDCFLRAWRSFLLCGVDTTGSRQGAYVELS
jgi:hypothetical protein